MLGNYKILIYKSQVSKKNVNDLSQSVEKLNELNSEDLVDYSKIEESLEQLKPELIEYSKKIQSEWKDLDVKINDLEISKSKLLNSFPEDIVKLYDQLKHNGVEIIAAYKNEDQCGCCGVSLTSKSFHSDCIFLEYSINSGFNCSSDSSIFE